MCCLSAAIRWICTATLQLAREVGFCREKMPPGTQHSNGLPCECLLPFLHRQNFGSKTDVLPRHIWSPNPGGQYHQSPSQPHQPIARGQPLPPRYSMLQPPLQLLQVDRRSKRWHWAWSPIPPDIGHEDDPCLGRSLPQIETNIVRQGGNQEIHQEISSSETKDIELFTQTRVFEKWEVVSFLESVRVCPSIVLRCTLRFPVVQTSFTQQTQGNSQSLFLGAHIGSV